MKPILSSGYRAGQRLPNRPIYSIHVIILKICTTSICPFVTKCTGNPDCTGRLGGILVSPELTKSLVTGVPSAQQVGVLGSNPAPRKHIDPRYCRPATRNSNIFNYLPLLPSSIAAPSFKTCQLPSFVTKHKCFFRNWFTVVQL